MEGMTKGKVFVTLVAVCILGGFATAFAFVEPSQPAPGGNVSGPLTIGSDGQEKEGPLTVNTDGSAAEGLIVENGELEVRNGESSFSSSSYSDPDNAHTYDAKFGGSNRGIAARGTSIFLGPVGIVDLNPDGSLDLDVNGQVGAEEYCDEDGNNCYTIQQLASGSPSIDDLTDGISDESTTVFLGLNAGGSNTGASNTALGIDALAQNTTGFANTALGHSTMRLNTTGGNTLAVGAFSLANNTTGNNNTGVGSYALEDNSTGSSNVAVGAESLRRNTTGGANAAMGWRALNMNTTGAGNVGVGYQAMNNNSTGGLNTALGFNALGANTSGQQNVGVGASALQGVTQGINNTSVGYNAGLSVSTGNRNVLLGASAGDAISSGANNIAIGYGAEVASTTGSQQLSIGNLIYGTGLNGINDTISTGSVGVGDRVPDATLKLDVEGQVGATEYCDENGANCVPAGSLGGGTPTLAQVTAQGATTTDNIFTGNVTIGENDILDFGNSTTQEDHISLFGSGVTGYGLGMEGSTMYSRSNGFHRWYIGELANGGASENMELDSNSLNFNNKTAIQYSDSWFRFNPNSQFSSGSYTPGLLRVDGGLEVDGRPMISNTGAIHTARYTDDSRYGFFEARNNSGNRGFYFGWGDGSGQVDLNLEASNRLFISGGSVGIFDATPDGSLLLDVEGQLGASFYCDQNGANCNSITDLASAGSVNDLTDGLSNTSRNDVFLGEGAGITSTGNENTGIGIESLGNNSSGGANTAVGTFAMNANLTGGNNTAIGNRALFGSTNRNNTTAIGAYVLESNSGSDNTAIGSEAMRNNGAGGVNTAIGYRALNLNDNGFGNTVIGYLGMEKNTSGSWNAAIGVNALKELDGGQRNVAIGTSALQSLETTASLNVAIGDQAANGQTTGNQNIAIGYNVALNDPAGSNQMTIGNLIYGTGINGQASGISSGNVGIGVKVPSYRLEVDGTAGKTGGGSWSNSSDLRLKDVYSAYEYGLDEIAALGPVRFSYKEGNARGLKSGTQEIGFIAQEVQKVIPDAVTEGEDGFLDFNMHAINVALVNAVKEVVLKISGITQRVDMQQMEVDVLQAQMHQAEERIEAQEKRIQDLEELIRQNQ